VSAFEGTLWAMVKGGVSDIESVARKRMKYGLIVASLSIGSRQLSAKYAPF
jgi:hypothetical protein